MVALLASAADRAQTGVFLAALVVIRIPVFLLTAVAPSFLPAMAEHASADRYPDFLRLVRRVLAGCLMLVIIACILAAALGPPVEKLLFGFHEELSRSTYFELTFSVGLFLFATVLAQSLLGLGHHASVAVGWVAGLVGLAAGTALAHGIISRATSGFLAGALVATRGDGRPLCAGDAPLGNARRTRTRAPSDR